MKNKNILILLLLCILLASCAGEDRRKEYAAQTGCDRWIESVMQENYYWYQDMTPQKLNYFQKPQDFLKTIRSSKDLDYSYIEEPSNIDALKSYGYQYDASTHYNDTAYAVRVLYVNSQSPAMEAQLKRGDWIVQRNGKYITRKQLDSLSTGNAVEFSRGTPRYEADRVYFDITDKVKVPAARVTTDNPVHFTGVYTTEKGKKVGYLMYKRFKSGETETETTYDDQLRAASVTFKSANISEFILDLRYNTGGEWEPLQLLGSILAPQSAMNKVMYTLEYNDKQAEQYKNSNFSSEILKGGNNLNLQNIYIITGSSTASISEILINSLSPYMANITIVGAATKGNFTGTHPYVYTNEGYHYILHLVDCMTYNSAEEVPLSGFQPKYSLNELTPVKIYELGDPKEFLLASTLGIIDGVTPQ